MKCEFLSKLFSKPKDEIHSTEDKITLYSMHTERCDYLQKCLDDKKLSYTLKDGYNVDELIEEMDCQCAPVLKVNGKCMEYEEALEWVNKR